MKRIPSLSALAALVVAAGAAAGFTAPPADQEPPVATAADADSRRLAADLEQVLRESGWPADRWAVMVISLDGGDTLFAHQPGTALAPASNLKLFTTAAALHYLGPDYRYATYLAATGPVRNGVLEGDLVLYGTGDPTMSGRFNEAERPALEAFADSLEAIGVTRVRGAVVGDASYFEGPGVGSGWQTTYITHTYAAPASALSFNDNVATLRVRPAAVDGEPPLVEVLPAGAVAFVNQARTVASGRTRIEARRASYDAPLALTGQIQRGTAGVWRAVPVPDPAFFTASVLAEILAGRGIAVEGGIRSINDPAESPVTARKVFAPALEEDRPALYVLAVHHSPPLFEILQVINKRSHNLYADAVLRTVGRVATGRGTVAGGQAAISALLVEESPASGTLVMDDGSGLSIRNRATPRSFVELLAFMERSPFRDHFLATLPEAAVDRGLRRMHQTAAAGNLRAKTGTIDNVSSLSGYVRAANGEMLAFSILSNDVPSTWRAKRIEDRIGARLASFSRPMPAARLAARETPATPADTAARTGPTPATVAGTTPEEEVAEAAAEMPAAAASTYVVKRGDTLDGIARRNGVTLNALEAANPGLNPRRLMPGQELAIPGG